MFKEKFGQKGQVTFNTPTEYYFALGFLANGLHNTSLKWEFNTEQGAWGDEGRIHFYNAGHPLSRNFKHTKGVGNVQSRVNCNEYVKHLCENHSFVQGREQNVDLIKATIPSSNLTDFEAGYNS